MMYTLNGIPADNPALGWNLTYDTQFVYSTTITRPEVLIPGYDGAVEMDGVESVPGVSLVWVVKESNLPGLRNVLRNNTLVLGKGAGAAPVSLRAFTPEKIGIGTDPDYQVTAELVIPGVWLRGDEVSQNFAVSNGAQTLDILPGSDGKVSDGTLTLNGPFNAGVHIQDVAGMSWIRYTQPIFAFQTVRYDMATGRAYLLSGETELGEVTQHLETGPDPYYLRFTPVVDAFNPHMAQPQLRITATGTDLFTSLSVQARPAFIL